MSQITPEQFAYFIKAQAQIDWWGMRHHVRVRYYANHNSIDEMKSNFPDFFKSIDDFVIKRDRDSLIAQADTKIKDCIENIKQIEKQARRLRNKDSILHNKSLKERTERELQEWERFYQELLVL